MVTVEGYHGAEALVGVDGGLVTRPLEEYGLTLNFLPTRKKAKELYDKVKHDHPTLRFAEENDEGVFLKNSSHDIAEPGRS